MKPAMFAFFACVLMYLTLSIARDAVEDFGRTATLIRAHQDRAFDE